MLRKARITLAVIFVSLITLLFLDFTGTLHSYFGWLAKIQFLPALLALHAGVVMGLIILTLLLGRIYCSVICPLGVMQDVFAWFGKKAKKNRYSYSPEKKYLRYATLGIFVVLMVAGLNSIAILVAPYSAYGRIVGTLLLPLYELANNGLAYIAERMDSYAFYTVDVWVKSLSLIAVALITLIGLAYLSWKNGRTWCNTICPVGTILSFISKRAIFGMKIDKEKCVGCGLCAKNCKSACIDPKTKTIDHSRCVTCFDCQEKCHAGAIQLVNLHTAKESTYAERFEEKKEQIDDSKRKFIATGSAMLAAATIEAGAKKVDGGLAVIQGKEIPNRSVTPKPAGSLSIKHFSIHCTACQLCVTACPNGVLRPSQSMEHFMQPEMSFERGYCRPECNKCAEVCPAGAIKPITVAEKSDIKIGHAVWIAANCLVETRKIHCGSCAAHCPTGAILMVPKDANDPESRKIPVVNTERCIGCGACENLCPARPLSAIYVEGYEVHHE